jgi:RecB family endonuclease NucS
VSIEKLKVENNQELEQMITNEINKVEKDLTVICSNVPITDQATLDILCHEKNIKSGIVKFF